MHDAPLVDRVSGLLLCCLGTQAQAPLIPPSFYAVEGAPYTLTVATHRQLVGRPQTADSTQHIARDSAGRQRYEAPLIQGSTGPRTVDIYDVVAGKRYVLDMEAKTAEVSPMRLGATVRLDASAAYSAAPVVPAQGEDLLGKRDIAGLEAWGQQTTRTMTRSDGTTVTQTRELWLSTHYRMPLLLVTHTPQIDMTQSVTAFQADEPDPALFRVPADFIMHDAPLPSAGAVAIGGNVSRPLLLKSVDPEFSEEARKKKIKGDILIHFVVDEKGVPQEVRVVRGLGSGLDEAAMKAVRQYRFKPAMRDGVPVPVELTVNVNFQIF